MKSRVERYQAGEHQAVWQELRALAGAVRDPANLADAEKVVELTFARVRSNLDSLIRALTEIGYAFEANSGPEETDWALELRLTKALAYASSRSGKQRETALAVFEDPALAWIREEKIVLPRRFFPHPQAPGIRCVDPDAATEIDSLEQRLGGPLPMTLKAWFVDCGTVDFRGKHPFLNPQSRVAGVRTARVGDCVRMNGDGHLPLFSDWQARIPDAGADAVSTGGRYFLDVLREAFTWAGLPALAAAANKPQRELDFIRSKLVDF